MAIYRECPYCGCNLDPGEKCECMEEMEYKKSLEKKVKKRKLASYILVEQDGMWEQQELAI